MTYVDGEGIHHLQHYNWADWDAKKKGAGSGANGRVGLYDTVTVGHGGGERRARGGKHFTLSPGASSGRVVGGLGDHERTLHIQTPSDEVHMIPKDSIKSINVTRAMPKTASPTPTQSGGPISGEVAMMGLHGMKK